MMIFLKELSKLAFAPVVLFGPLATGLYLISSGYSYGVLPVLLGLAIGISFGVERVIPYEKLWHED